MNTSMDVPLNSATQGTKPLATQCVIGDDRGVTGHSPLRRK